MPGRWSLTCLAVDPNHQRILLGTNTPGKQLWVVVYSPDWSIQEYANEYLDEDGGVFSETQLLAKPGDRFSGICAGDPGADAPIGVVVSRTLALPVDDGTSRPCYEIAASRAYDAAADQDLIHVYLGNLTCMRSTAPTAALAVSLSGTFTGSFLVTPRGPYDVFRFTAAVPKIPAAIGRPWRFRWTPVTPRGQVITTHEVTITP